MLDGREYETLFENATVEWGGVYQDIELFHFS
jgi:hypothetical protein